MSSEQTTPGAGELDKEREHPVINMILAETRHDWEIPLIPPDRHEHWRKVCFRVYRRNASVACHLLVAAQRAWRIEAMRGLAIQLMMLMEAAGFGPIADIAREVNINPAEIKRAARLINNVKAADTSGALTPPSNPDAGVKPLGPKGGKPWP